MREFAGFPQRKDILYIPWLYTPNYCIEENKLFSYVFTAFPYEERQKQRDKQIELLNYNIQIMKEITVYGDNKFSGIYYNNIIDDFDIHPFCIGGIKNIYGFQHDSCRQSYLAKKPQSKKLINYEDAIGKIASKVFVGSEFMKSFLPYKDKIDVIGLPIFAKKLEPRNNSKILFNHRFAMEKNWQMLFDLPEQMRDNLILTTPTATCASGYAPVWRQCKEVLKMKTACPKVEVDVYQSSVGFGLSFSEADNFGISVLEGIMSGLFYMCWQNEYNCFSETLMPEFLFKDINELVEKYNYYNDNPAKRFDIIQQQQNKIENYSPKKWIKSLLSKLE